MCENLDVWDMGDKKGFKYENVLIIYKQLLQTSYS